MPLQNRVNPYGELVAVTSRGTMLGNRGRLHDADRKIVRASGRMNWLSCRLKFRGRHRQVMSPRSYTELFFLDEATTLSAGHRPCSECRHAQYTRFRTCWALSCRLRSLPFARDMDTCLANDRATSDGQHLSHDATAATLPDGVVIEWQLNPWLLWSDKVHRWTFDGYTERKQRSVLPGTVTVLTPQIVVEVLRAGYVPDVHDSAGTRSVQDDPAGRPSPGQHG